MSLSLDELLDEYDAAQGWSLALVVGLTPEQIGWRPHENSSAIAWHLGHQAAVNHFMLRNLTAAEPSFDKAFDAIFDSATPEPERGDLPSFDDVVAYRHKVAGSTHATIGRIASGDVGAPDQLAFIAQGLLRAVINHEYQHARWIGEVRDTWLAEEPPYPSSHRLEAIDGYFVLR